MHSFLCLSMFILYMYNFCIQSSVDGQLSCFHVLAIVNIATVSIDVWYWHNGHELGKTSGNGEGQGGLECCGPWGCKESDTTWQLNNMYVLELWFSQGVCPVVGLLGHMIDLFLVFKGISTLFSIMAISVYIPTSNVGGFSFFHILSSIYCL